MREELQEWFRFIRAETHNLSSDPQLLFQQAANRAADSAQSKAAKHLWANGRTTRAWLSIVNKAQGPSGCLMTLDHFRADVTAVAVASDSRKIAAAGEPSALAVWRADNGELLKLFKIEPLATNHEELRNRLWITKLMFTPDGSRLLSGGADGVIRAHDVERGGLVFAVPGHVAEVSGMRVTPDSNKVITCGADGAIKVWDAATGRFLYSFSEVEQALLQKRFETTDWTHDYFKDLAMTHDGRYVLAAGDQLVFCEVESGTVIRRQKLVGDSIDAVTATADRTSFVSASWSRLLTFWDAATGIQLRQLKPNRLSIPNVMTETIDGNYLVISDSLDGSFSVFDCETGERLGLLRGHAEKVTALDTSSDGHYVVSGSRDGLVKVWNARHLDDENRVPGHTSGVIDTAVSEATEYGASVDVEGLIKIWDVRSGEELQTLKGHTKKSSVQFTSDSRRLVSASLDNTIRIWDVVTGDNLLTLTGHTHGPLPDPTTWYQEGNLAAAMGYAPTDERTADSGVLVAVISPDGELIASGGFDRTLRIWHAPSGRLLHTCEGHGVPVVAAVFTPDGKHVVSSAEGNTLRICSTNSGSQVTSLRLSHPVQRLTISLDGQRILACGGRTVSLLNAQSWELLNVWKDIDVAAVDAKSRYAVSTQDHGRLSSLTVWDLDTGVCRCDLVSQNNLDPFECVALDTNGRFVVAGTFLRWLWIWDLESKCLLTRFNITARPTSISVRDDYILVGDDGGGVHILKLYNPQWLN